MSRKKQRGRAPQNASDLYSTIAFDTIDLQRLMVASSVAVDEECVIHALELRDWRDETLRRLFFSLRGYVWAEPPKSISVRYPTTWWDAFKARWFPEWAIEAYPVNYTVETMEGQIFYPKLPHTVPERAHNLRMVVHKESFFCPVRDENQ